MTDLKKVVGFLSDSGEIDGKLLEWTHLFIAYPKDKVSGLVTEKVRCANVGVLDNVSVGDFCKIYYDDKGKGILIQSVQPDDDTLYEYLTADPDSVPERYAELMEGIK